MGPLEPHSVLPTFTLLLIETKNNFCIVINLIVNGCFPPLELELILNTLFGFTFKWRAILARVQNTYGSLTYYSGYEDLFNHGCSFNF